MKKSIVITSILLAFFSLCSIITLVGYVIGENDISFPIGYGIFAFIFAYLLFFIARGKELPLSRMALKSTLKFCRDPQNNEKDKTKKLEKYLNTRRVLFLKLCPVCDKSSFNNVSNKPCRRCKTLFTYDTEKFTLECKGMSAHRLASLYSSDFNELRTLIWVHNPSPNVSDYYSSDDNDIHVTIIINK